MTTCLQSITTIINTDTISSVQVLHANTITHFPTIPSGKKLFFFETSKREIIKFVFNLNPVGSVSQIEMNVAIFKYNDASKQLTPLGGALLNDLNQEFQKDMDSGYYFMCITNKYASFDVAVTGVFTSFTQFARISFTCYSGESYKPGETYKSHPCTSPISFKLIAGSLPPGLTLSERTGCITGILPNMDCLDENALLPPGADWFGQLPTGEWYPWGRQWRFRVKAWLADFNNILTDSWFCIRIFNDWDREKQNILSQLPLTEIIPYSEDLYDPIILPELCSPCEVPEKPKPVVECVPCHEKIDTSVRPIILPKPLCDIKPDELLSWWEQNRNAKNLSTDIQKFLTELEHNDIFRLLLIKKGLLPSLDQEAIALAKSKIMIDKVNGVIKLKLEKLKNGRNTTDYDYIMLHDINKLNQVLDMDFIMFGGETLNDITLR